MPDRYVGIAPDIHVFLGIGQELLQHLGIALDSRKRPNAATASMQSAVSLVSETMGFSLFEGAPHRNPRLFRAE